MSILTAFTFWILQSTSIYSLQFQDIDGNTRQMSQYEGKKILLVNIATGSSRVSQLTGLQQLHQQHGDSLVIIGFPSNSFGNETRTNAEIKQFCSENYGITFLLAAKTDVTGAQIHPLYHWLTTMEENGVSGELVQRSFQKFLISKTGTLVGVYSPTVEPANIELTGL